MLKEISAVEMEDTIGGDAWDLATKIGGKVLRGLQIIKTVEAVGEVFTDFANRPLTTPLRGDGSYPSSLNAEGVRGTPFYSGD